MFRIVNVVVLGLSVGAIAERSQMQLDDVETSGVRSGIPTNVVENSRLANFACSCKTEHLDKGEPCDMSMFGVEEKDIPGLCNLKEHIDAVIDRDLDLDDAYRSLKNAWNVLDTEMPIQEYFSTHDMLMEAYKAVHDADATFYKEKQFGKACTDDDSGRMSQLALLIEKDDANKLWEDNHATKTECP